MPIVDVPRTRGRRRLALFNQCTSERSRYHTVVDIGFIYYVGVLLGCRTSTCSRETRHWRGPRDSHYTATLRLAECTVREVPSAARGGESCNKVDSPRRCVAKCRHRNSTCHRGSFLPERITYSATVLNCRSADERP